MSERLSDEEVAWWANATRKPNCQLAREVQEWRKLRDDWLKVFPPPSEINDLCARHDITVEGIVALVGGVFYVDGYEASVRPDTGWDNCLTHLRRLARGEEA